MTRLGRVLAVCTLPWLAACATVSVTDPAPWITGRLSLQMEAHAGQAARSASAAFELRAHGEAGELRLNSPLGIRAATARWAPGLAALDQGQGEQVYASLAELSQQALGEALPLQALPDWLAGRPWPAAPHAATAVGFEQVGWDVNLARRSEGWVEMRRAAPPALRLRVKLDEVP